LESSSPQAKVGDSGKENAKGDPELNE